MPDSPQSIGEIRRIEGLELRGPQLTQLGPQAAASLSAQEQELDSARRLQQISTRLILGDNVEAMYGALLDAAVGITHSEMASMQMVDEGEDGLRMLAWRGFGAEFGQIFGLNPRGARTSCSVAREQGQRVVVPDVERWEYVMGTPALAEHRQVGIRAVQSTPLVSRSGKVLGVISTHWHRPHEPAAHELLLLDVLARQAADIIERHQTERLRAHLSAIVESSGDAIISKNLDGVIRTWNAAAERIFGFTAEEACGQPSTIMIPLERHAEERSFLERIGRGERIDSYETVRIQKNGQRLPVSLTFSPIRDSSGDIIGASIIARDISASKLAEEQLNRALQEKETLLRELQHRVKNNLQLISSLLSLQAEDHSDVDVRGKFQESQERIRSIALIYDKLHQSKELSRLDTAAYVEDLVSSLLHAHAVKPEQIKIELDVDQGPLGLDAAVPCGLILNELITNALKYAFPGGRPGRIRIELRVEAPQRFRLSVEDDGVGLPEGLDVRNTDSLGLQLVNALTRQLHGSLAVEQARGTAFRFSFREGGA